MRQCVEIVNMNVCFQPISSDVDALALAKDKVHKYIFYLYIYTAGFVSSSTIRYSTPTVLHFMFHSWPFRSAKMFREISYSGN